MIEALFSHPTYLATKKMLDATVLRHEAIASNLANIETPNYRRLDLAPDFNQQLQQAMSAGNPTQVGQLHPKLAVDPSAHANGRDGNTVQLESELVQLSQNTVAHALETQLVSSHLSRLRMAVTGKSI